MLTKRAIEPFIGTWHLPGGRVWYRESIDKAIGRIGLAELGVELRVGVEARRLLGYMEVINDGEYTHSVSLVFLTEEKVGGLFIGDRQSSQIRTFTELPENTFSYHRLFLEEHLGEILNSRSLV